MHRLLQHQQARLLSLAQVSMLHNTKNKKFLDYVFRDVSMLSKGGSEVQGAEERDR